MKGIVLTIILTAICTLAGNYFYEHYLQDKPELHAVINHHEFSIPEKEVKDKIRTIVQNIQEKKLLTKEESRNLDYGIEHVFDYPEKSIFNFSTFLIIKIINTGEKPATNLTLRFPEEVLLSDGRRIEKSIRYGKPSLEPNESITIKIWSQDALLGSSESYPIFISYADGVAEIEFNSLQKSEYSSSSTLFLVLYIIPSAALVGLLLFFLWKSWKYDKVIITFKGKKN